MDADSLTASFLSWSEEHESDLTCELMFESASEGKLRFHLDNALVTLNFEDSQASVSGGKKTHGDWVGWSNSYLVDHSGDILTGELTIQQVLTKAIQKYESLKSNSDQRDDEADEEEEMEVDAENFSDEEDIDYHQEILEQDRVSLIRDAQRTGKKGVSIEGLARLAESHFIFLHALEGRQLLIESFRGSPGLEYSMQVSTHYEIALIKLELDLSFLDITEETMNMLGLTFDEPLSINISINENRLLQTMDSRDWTPSLLGIMDIECLQGTKMDSFGCKEYIPGRITRFKKAMHEALSESQSLPTFLEMTRSSSTNTPAAVEGPRKSARKADPQHVKTLVQMGFGKAAAIMALKSCNNVMEVAVEHLSTHSTPPAGQTEVINTSNNFFYNLLYYLRDRLQSCTNYCLNCYEKHPSDSFRLRACNKEICEFRFEEVSGLSVYAELLNNLNLVELDMSFAACAADSGRALSIFEPFPSFLLKDRQIRGKSGYLSRDKVTYTPEMDQNKNLDQLKTLISLVPSLQWLRDSSCDETSLIQNLISAIGESGREVYKLLRYIIATNRLSLVKLDGEDRIDGLTGSIDQYIVTNHSPETLQFFNEEKAKHGSFFAFHGSATENWYSIVRNGLRNMSNSHLMTCGAAYGSGVYAAANFGTSLGYCRQAGSSSVWRPNILTNPPSLVMAIIEVIKGGYDKGNGIYVIPNDRHIVIRYLMKFSNYSSSADANKLDLSRQLTNLNAKFARVLGEVKNARVQEAIRKGRKREQDAKAAEELFQKEMAARRAREAQEAEEAKVSPEVESRLKRIEEAFAGQGSISANKRILNEYKYLSTSKDCVGISVEFEGGDNMYVWIASLDMDQFEVPKELKGDFTLFAQRTGKPKHLVFEVRFDAKFPFSPPFLRVIRPRFAFHTGHITVGGSVCMQSITPSGWIPVRTVESIFIEILFNMGEGGARLDLNQLGVDYSLAEAQDAFVRVAKQHNWIS